MIDRSSDRVVAEMIGVSRTYPMGDTLVHALDDFSFRFGEGEYWAVMGSSGSGKSTLLNLLGCIDRPTSGVYRVRDRDVAARSVLARTVLESEQMTW